MDDSPDTCSLSPADEAHLRATLEAGGNRCTRQRAAVYAYLKSVVTHPTAEEVYRAVQTQAPNISLATVYNSLEALVETQLAVKIAGDGPARYDCRTDNHYHLRCLKTGQVRDVEVPHDPTLVSKLAPHLIAELRAAGFEVTDYRLELVGHFTRETASS